MVSKVVTVGEDEAAYDVLMEVDEKATSTDTVDKLSRAQAEAKTKAQLVDYVALPEETEEDDNGGDGGTEDA